MDTGCPSDQVGSGSKLRLFALREACDENQISLPRRRRSHAYDRRSRRWKNAKSGGCAYCFIPSLNHGGARYMYLCFTFASSENHKMIRDFAVLIFGVGAAVAVEIGRNSAALAHKSEHFCCVGK